MKRGFTLIELLVVIAIIGMLSSLVLASLNSARAKGRDARRLADLKEIANLIIVSETSPVAALPTCAHGAKLSACSNPDLSRFSDPSGSSTACTSSSTGVCEYAIYSIADSTTNFNDWVVCAYVEKGAGSARSTAGMIGVSSSDYSVHSGCAN